MRSERSQKETLIVCRLFLNLVRTNSKILEDGDNFSHAFPDLMLCAAIFIGEAERRPMSPAKLAAYIGMPRPTVLRRIDALVASGHVCSNRNGGLKLVRSDAKLIKQRIATVANLQHISRAFLALSKMDTQAIAAQPRLRLQNANDAQTGNGKSSE